MRALTLEALNDLSFHNMTDIEIIMLNKCFPLTRHTVLEKVLGLLPFLQRAGVRDRLGRQFSCAVDAR